MDRMQIYLETEQRLRLNALARAHGRPAAELVREAVSRYLEEETQSVSPRDPLFDLIGAAGDLETATDVSSNKHRYLALADIARSRYTSKAEKPRRATSVRKLRGRGR
jgi:hypothetical protein